MDPFQNPNGQTPVQTQGDGGNQGNPQPTAPQPVKTVEQLEAELAIAKDEALRANRAIELGRKFEKFEDFQAAVLGEINGLKTETTDLRKENEDLKTIISNRAAVTPNVNTAPTPPVQTQNETEEEKRTRNMFGLPPITQK